MPFQGGENRQAFLDEPIDRLTFEYEKIPPCPCCGNNVTYINDARSSVVCLHGTCDYRTTQKLHAEICAALAYYRKMKGNECKYWNYENGECEDYSKVDK